MTSPKRALVTGGAGFIGSHLCDLLISQGWEVTALDDLSTGKEANLAHLEGKSGFQLVQGNCCDRALMAELLSRATAAFHLAAMVSVPQSLQEPQRCFHSNVQAFGDLLSLLRQRPIPLVYASSAAVYGDQQGPCREDMVPQPLSPYGASKAMGELLATTTWRCWQLPSVGLRFFNIYGPRQSLQGASVIPRFCAALASGQSPQIFGDGLQTRDYLYVTDLVRMMVWAAETPQVFGRVLNLASGQSVPLREVLEILSKLWGDAPKPQFFPARPGDIRHSSADVSSLRQLGAPLPQVSLDQGLAWTLDFVKEQLRR